jgi:diguanylate cyclase (GGDEF)-like protein/PAS domain S-box-containing protein
MMFLTSVISIQLAIYIFLNRKKILLPGFLGLIISVAIYSVFYSLEIIAPNLEYMKLCTSIEYLGILSIPAFWIIMAIEYTNKENIIQNKFRIRLFFIPICLMILNFTNEYHHLFYKSYSYNIIYSLHIADLIPGVLYYVAMLYINLCFFIGNMLYVRNFFRENNLYKKRSVIIMITSFIPWIGYWTYMIGVMPVKIDIVPISMAILCLFYAYALFNSNIFGTLALVRRIIFDDITDAIIVLDKDNILIEINKKAEQIFNIKNDLIIGKNSNDIFKGHNQLLKNISENKVGIFYMEIKIMDKVHYFQGKIDLLKSGKNEGKFIILIDNTEQIALNKKLEYYATMDSLTGVYNRSYFYEIAVSKLTECNTMNKPVSLIMFDLDKFKDINDNYGHLAGDTVLKKVLECCKNILSEKHYLGRYGGEEFVILLNETNIEKALEIAESIRVAIEEADILYEDIIIKITSSFGVFTSYKEKNLKYLLKNADEALYEAKKSGRNKVCGDNDIAV